QQDIVVGGAPPRRLTRHKAGRRFTRLAMPAGDRGQGALPVETSSFIGRADELTRVKECLTRSRLVTLTGIGGVGKTRIALRVAAEQAIGVAGGVRLVQLAHIADPALVPNVLAAALGLPGRSASWTQ